jgi:hypothetical protein
MESAPVNSVAGFRRAFPNQATLHPETGDASKDLIESTFEKVRGSISFVAVS